ncbi:hypothetical protein [Actinoplanes sp. NBRC 101535]|uniref:hypothetical protein n=1 Tax=Actinoplanes sp. NBRC 101535 TaxID=3032196 RepID=UPI0024A01DAB|nr:hypothetical protein [Actinoplanes sp. NBRC 101535]GLY01586.1 hypothetical protein Acsp01_19650 [Actinoplanes sp. NBRC 101535]
MTRLGVERVDRIGSRPWVFVTGELDGAPLSIGDELTVTPERSVVIRAVEFHSAPGRTTIAVDADVAGLVGGAGTVLTVAD